MYKISLFATFITAIGLVSAESKFEIVLKDFETHLAHGVEAIDIAAKYKSDEAPTSVYQYILDRTTAFAADRALEVSIKLLGKYATSKVTYDIYKEKRAPGEKIRAAIKDFIETPLREVDGLQKLIQAEARRHEHGAGNDDNKSDGWPTKNSIAYNAPMLYGETTIPDKIKASAPFPSVDIKGEDFVKFLELYIEAIPRLDKFIEVVYYGKTMENDATNIWPSTIYFLKLQITAYKWYKEAFEAIAFSDV